jgi:hypothetical protein
MPCKPSSGCCPPAPAEAAKPVELTDSGVRDVVQQYYGEELITRLVHDCRQAACMRPGRCLTRCATTHTTRSEDLKTSACKTCTPPPREIRDLLKEVPEEVSIKFYGCGTPLPMGTTGLRVLDLGSGSGRDCYVAARLVGETGFVTGGLHAAWGCAHAWAYGRRGLGGA